MKERRRIIYFWRIILWLGVGFCLLWLFYQNLVPTGILVLHNKKGSAASPISDLHPAKRLIEINEDDPPHRRASNNQTFYIDPVYFDVKVPRRFDKIMVDIAWQNQAQPILELGARKARDEFNFILKPLQNKIIDTLDWSCGRFDGILFCQKEKRFQSLADYLAKPLGRLVTYHYRPAEKIKYDEMNVNSKIENYDYLIADYEPPESLGNNWFKRRLEFNWEDFALYVNEISFVISAPELHQGHGQIVLGDMTITLQRPPLDWEEFKKWVKKRLRR